MHTRPPITTHTMPMNNNKLYQCHNHNLNQSLYTTPSNNNHMFNSIISNNQNSPPW